MLKLILKNKSRNQLLLSLVIVGGIILIAHAMGIILCPLRRFFEIPCPGCGGTRAFFSILRGDWSNAIALNPLAVCLFVVAPLWILFFREKILSKRQLIFLIILACILVLANWIYILKYSF